MLSSLLSWTILPEGSSSAVHLKRKINLEYHWFYGKGKHVQDIHPKTGLRSANCSLSRLHSSSTWCKQLSSHYKFGFKTYPQEIFVSIKDSKVVKNNSKLKQIFMTWSSTWTPETPNFWTSSVKTPGSLSIRHQLPASDILGLGLEILKGWDRNRKWLLKSRFGHWFIFQCCNISIHMLNHQLNAVGY